MAETTTSTEAKREDITLTCRHCGASFIWTASEQRFYSERDLSEPHRCQQCRALRRSRPEFPGYRGPR